MAEVKTYRCDVCKKLKQEANHWFRAKKHPGDSDLTSNIGPSFSITTWDSPASSEDLHLCGMECAHKAMAEAMES